MLVKTDRTRSCKTEHQTGHPTRKVGRFLYVAFGFLALTLGAIGTVMPFIPTTPLVLLAAFCFGKSSRRLHNWFLSTRLYRKNLESFAQKKGMTVQTKLTLLALVTFFMGLSFVFMLVFAAPLFARVTLGVVWFGHVLYFGFKVKTIP